MQKNLELLSSLVYDIHQAAAEHMQEGRGCVDRAKASIFLKQAAHYQCTKFLLGHRYYYLTLSKTTVKKRSKKMCCMSTEQSFCSSVKPTF